MTESMIALFGFKNYFRGSPIRWLVVGGILLIAAIMIGTTIMASNFRERALKSKERELENTVLLLSRHFDQQLEDIGVIQNDFIGYIKSLGITSSESFKFRMSSQDIHSILRAKLNAQSYVGGITIFDADGKLINGSATWPSPDVSIANRPYFEAFKSDPRSPELLISPVHSRITGV